MLKGELRQELSLFSGCVVCWTIRKGSAPMIIGALLIVADGDLWLGVGKGERSIH